MFPAYGAQIVHMPFGSVYTSLQTGVVDMAENGVNVYDSNKHYEVAPVMSMTEHEANCNLLWCSGKVWDSLSPEQQGWVRESATEVATKEPAQAIELEHKSRAKLEKMGVKFVAGCGQVGLHQGGGTVAGEDRRRSWPARDEDPAALPLDYVAASIDRRLPPCRTCLQPDPDGPRRTHAVL